MPLKTAADMTMTLKQSPNLSAALKLARQGFVLFPCDPATKAPMPGLKWQQQATIDIMQIRKWWGRWPNAMPGLPTGSINGFSVVDLDVHGGKDGLSAYKKLGLDTQDVAFCVKTARGGLHLYFDHQTEVRNSTTKAGIDVRGEGGYVIAPGAIGAAGKYKIVNGDIAAASLLGFGNFPRALRKEIEPPETQAGSGGYAVADLHDALFAIPNDIVYDDWVKVMMAVHHATGGSKGGLSLVQAWSADYPGYNSKEVAGKWRSFGRAEGALVTVESLFAEARNHGWCGDIDREFDDLDDDTRCEIEDLLDATPEQKDGPLTFLSPLDCAVANPRPYVVKNLIAKDDVGCIVGAPGVGKSVLAPALAYAVAQRRDVHGKRVRQGSVFYVAAEDEHGMRGRIAALKAEHGDADDFVLVGGVTDLLSEDVQGKRSRDFRALRKAVKERRPSLIVVDTLAMAFPGLEENSAEGMGKVVAVARELTRWGAAVLLVHHDTKDGQQGLPRGHSLLNGALDLSVHLSKTKGGFVRGRLTKNRNGPVDLEMAFQVKGVPIGTDEDGDPVTAALCEPVEPTNQDIDQQLSSGEAAALNLAIELMGDRREIDLDDWVDAAVSPDELRITTATKLENRKRSVRRILGQLVAKNQLALGNGQVRLAEIGIDAEFEEFPEESET